MKGLPYIKIEDARHKICPFRVFVSQEGETMHWNCEADDCMKWEPCYEYRHGAMETQCGGEKSKTHGRCGKE